MGKIRHAEGGENFYENRKPKGIRLMRSNKTDKEEWRKMINARELRNRKKI
jgi:hypothetical protein